MEHYKNLSGQSNIAAFESSAESISIMFNNGSIYLYTYNSAGIENIEHMKKLAAQGQGLSSFISTEVKHKYETKLK